MDKVQRTLLIVDALQEERMLIRRALGQDASIDYQVLEAENGAQALAYLHEQQPDCLLLDEQLPDIDGFTLLQTVVQQALPHIYPVVMLTSNSRMGFVGEIRQQGAHDFLTKALLVPEQLERAINNAIEKVALLRQLEEQREWFRLTLANISEGVIMTDRAGSVTFMNPVAEALTSWNASEAQGQPLAQIFHPIDATTRQPAAADVSEILRAQELVSQTNYALLAGQSGRELPIDYNAAPIHDRRGNLNGVVLTLRDISERKEADQKIRQSEERYRTLFETIDEGLCVFEMIFDAADRPLDYRFLEVNPAFARFTGLEDAVGKTARQLVPNLEANWFEIYGQVALTGEPQHFVEGSAAMGRWFEVYAFRFGRPESRRVALLFTNITERKQVEDRLRQQEELLRQIADNVPGLIGLVGADERYHFVNATFETWFQRSRQQIIGSTVRELIGEVEYVKLSTYRQRALAGETVSYETTFAYPDRVTRAVWGRYQPHRAADGTMLGFYLFMMDISERKQAEADAHLLADLAETIRQADDADALLWAVTQSVGDYLQVGRCRLMEVNAANDRVRIHRDYCRGVSAVSGELQLSNYNPITWGELAAGRTVVNHDAQHDPRTAELYATIYEPTGDRAYISVPLLRNGQWQGVLAVTTPEARQWQLREVQLLETVAERTWLAAEKLRLDATVRASEEELRQITDHLPSLISVVNERGEYEFVNRNYQRWLGLEPAQIIGRSIAAVLPDAAYQVSEPNLRRALAGETVTFENRVATPQNDKLDLTVTYVPRHAADGRVTGCYVLATDITERKRAEEALRASEAQLTTILYNIPAAVYMMTTDHRYLLVNRIYEQENNITNAEIHGQSVYDRWPAEIAETLTANERQVLRTKAPVEIEETVQRDGKTRHYATIKAPLINDAGEPYAIIGISTDITARKQAEAALAAREAFLRAITDAVPNLIGYIDQDRRYRFVNATYAQWFARPREQIEGNTMQALLGDHLQAWHSRWPRVLAGEMVNFEETFTYPDGVNRTVMGTCIPDQAAGQVLGFYLYINDITARKQAEAAVAARETELRVITDHIPGLISYVDSEQRYRFANAAYEKFYNQPRNQIIGQPVHAAQSKAVYDQVQPYIARALQGELVQFEAMLPYPTGARTIWGTYVPNIDDQGITHGFYALVTDISERKRAEEALRASEGRFRQLAEAMPQIVWACQADGALTYINEQWLAYSGMSLAQTLQQGMWSALHPADQAANRADWQRALNSGQAYEAELRLRGADGQYRWHLERAVPIRNDAGVIEQWFGATVDIDDHKRAQEALTRANERFILAEHASNGWVYDFDVQQWKVERSPGFSRILGYTPEEIEPDVAWWHSLFHPEDRRLVENQAISARNETEFTEVEYRVRHRDGHYVHLMDRSRNIYNAAGQSVRIVGITVDISERKQAEQALQQFNERLDQQVKERTVELTKRLRELDQFAYVTSHDLKAPLRAIDHLAHWISGDAGDLLPAASRDHLEKMRGRIMRMEKLLDDLLAYSRADRLEYRAEKVDLALLLDNIVRLVTPPQGFAVHVQTPLPLLITQKVPLETVLRNLINNAIKHHDRSDGMVQVAVQDLGEFLEFSVSDDGPGIAAEFHERIFQVFQTLKPRDVVEGSGMGLAIVKKIIESRNGRITVNSMPGRGALFQFIWPKG